MEPYLVIDKTKDIDIEITEELILKARPSSASECIISTLYQEVIKHKDYYPLTMFSNEQVKFKNRTIPTGNLGDSFFGIRLKVTSEVTEMANKFDALAINRFMVGCSLERYLKEEYNTENVEKFIRDYSLLIITLPVPVELL